MKTKEIESLSDNLPLRKRAWLDRLPNYFLYFIMYSMVGWFYEVFLEVVVYQWGYSDRGVLTGPYCPVYGVGALTFLLCLHEIMQKKEPRWFRWVKPLILFLGCLLIATAIELLASYLLEHFTGSWPWQTYRDYAVNYQGRIALSPSIRFGLGGLVFLYVLQPLFEKLVGKMSAPARRNLAAVVGALFAVDLIAYWLR